MLVCRRRLCYGMRRRKRRGWLRNDCGGRRRLGGRGGGLCFVGDSERGRGWRREDLALLRGRRIIRLWFGLRVRCWICARCWRLRVLRRKERALLASMSSMAFRALS